MLEEGGKILVLNKGWMQKSAMETLETYQWWDANKGWDLEIVWLKCHSDDTMQCCQQQI